jgi:hypothetical protein
MPEPHAADARVKHIRNGHASTHLRHSFQEFLDCGDPTTPDDLALTENLLNCTDILPAGYCDLLDIPKGSDYGLAARIIVAEARSDRS